MKKRYGEVAKQILGIVGITGVVIIAAAAPGTLLIAKLFEQNGQKFPTKSDRQKATRAMQRLQKTNHIRIKQKQGKLYVELTKEGRKKLKEIELSKLKIIKPVHWDNKWRIIIFDIPENSSKYAREALRRKLKEWQFYQLQKSVWVCPWPCESEIQTITELYEINLYVNIITADKILNDTEIRKHFDL